MNTYYHLTKLENKDSIINNGLVPREGKLYLFDDVDVKYPEGLFRFDKWTNRMRLIPVSDIIAKLEVGIKDYSLFKVEVGSEVFQDNKCGESLVMDHQHYVTEPVKNVEYIGDYTVGNFWDYELLDEKYEIPEGYKVVHFKAGNKSFGFGIVEK